MPGAEITQFFHDFHAKTAEKYMRQDQEMTADKAMIDTVKKGMAVKRTWTVIRTRR